MLIVANNADQSEAVKLDVKQTSLEGARRIRALLGTGLLGSETTDPVGADAITLTVPGRSLSIYQAE